MERENGVEQVARTILKSKKENLFNENFAFLPFLENKHDCTMDPKGQIYSEKKKPEFTVKNYYNRKEKRNG